MRACCAPPGGSCATWAWISDRRCRDVILKLLTALVAVVLVLAYVLAPALKLKDAALATVIVIGVVLMLIDLAQSLRERD